MPFVSAVDQRTRFQNMVPYEDVIEPGFAETFDAAVGQVIDEELSISRWLNRQGWQDRKDVTEELLSEGVIKSSKYFRRRGGFDYERLAQDGVDPRIKTNAQLTEERNRILAMRRGYAQDVLERGSGVAQFLGGGTAYMLDPINIATVPISTAATAGKGLSVIGRALMTARNEAALGVAAELAIQPMVYEHKLEIDSPFTAVDAIQNIVGAAIGSAAFGGVTGGLVAYLDRAGNAVKAIPESQVTEELEQAVEYVTRLKETIKSAPEPDLAKVEADFIEQIKTQALADASNKLTRGQRKQLRAELNDLEVKLGRVEEAPEPVRKERGVPAREAKRRSIQEGQALAAQERQLFQDRITAINRQLEQSELAQRAEGNLSRLEQGIIPEEFRAELDELKATTEIESQAQFLTELEEQRAASVQPSRTPEKYIVPEREVPAEATTISRQTDILDEVGLREEYNRAMDDLAKLEDPKIIEDGKLIDGQKFFDDIDEQLNGLDDVMVCVRGKS